MGKDRLFNLDGFLLDFSLKKVDLFNIKLMLKGKELLHVVSLQLEDLFVF
jgi:hypothetical protein